MRTIIPFVILNHWGMVLVAQVGDKPIIAFDTLAVDHEEVVISASRFEQKLSQSPVTIHVISAKAVQGAASGDFFESMGNLPQIDVVNNSFNFKVFNTRGFNSTVGYRVVQMIDGADNLSSGINFSPGNFLSIPDIDVARTEVISGPASALYGPNAMQGVVSIISRDPYEQEGLDVKLAGGNREYFSGQFRYAQAVGKARRFAFKVTGEYNRARDWVAHDEKANVYIPRPSAPQNLDNQIQQTAADPATGEAMRQLYTDFLAYASTSPGVLPGTRSFPLKGYREGELFDSLSQNLKLMGSIHYRFRDSTEILASYRMVRASGTFQGNQRVYFDNQMYHQPKLEVKRKNFLFRTYATFENLGESYSFNILGANLALAGLTDVRSTYINDYINQIHAQSGGFTSALGDEALAESDEAAMDAAGGAWLEPGTEAFNAVADRVIGEPAKPQGARFVNESKMFHTDAQYNFALLNWVDINAGASFRYNIPRTFGSVLSDTLSPDGTYADISYYETGGFLQLTKGLLGDMIVLTGSVRVDKSNYFEPQVSPRGSITFNLRNHNIRLLAQSAFRNPTQNEQFFLLNTGSLVVLGNITGYSNMYTLGSVGAFAQSGDASDLRTITIPRLRPENVKSFEVGYRANLFRRMTMDLSGYFNIYSDFIGRINTAQPDNGTAGEASGEADIMAGDFRRYSIMANSTADVNSYGASIALNCNVGKGISIYGNYTYSGIDSSNIKDDLIPGFNTPMHKFNLGVEGRNVWKGLGFSANFRWVDTYHWESPFATGLVPSFHTLDLQLNYAVRKAHSIVRVGAANIYNNRHIEAFGAATIGAFYYASWTVSIAREHFTSRKSPE
jgi:iron complex outermembrane recepter protein